MKLRLEPGGSRASVHRLHFSHYWLDWTEYIVGASWGEAGCDPVWRLDLCFKDVPRWLGGKPDPLRGHWKTFEPSECDVCFPPPDWPPEHLFKCEHGGYWKWIRT